MARPKDETKKINAGAATNVEPRAEEQRPADAERDLEETVPGAGVERTEAPQDEPGPEDFERHTLAQLKAGKATDMTLRADLERRLAEVKDREARRDAVFAPRFLQAAADQKVRNPVLDINGIKLVPRAKKGGAGGFVAHTERAALNIP